jgi:hypothetical protein
VEARQVSKTQLADRTRSGGHRLDVSPKAAQNFDEPILGKAGTSAVRNARELRLF